MGFAGAADLCGSMNGELVDLPIRPRRFGVFRDFDHRGEATRDWVSFRVPGFGGEGGIRTHGTREGYNGFRDRPDRPLRHPSAKRCCNRSGD
jgi:hypothetical protein